MNPQQRISIAAHEAWRVQMAKMAAKLQPDPIDDAMADPVLDHIPQRRSGKAAKSVLAMLDNLSREGK
jgi:hypothetical protein